MAHIDWNSMKTEYITTGISHRKLAEKFGVQKSNIAARSKQEGWVAGRRQYREKTVTKAVTKASDKQANHLASLMISADKMAASIQKALEDEDQLYRYTLQKREKYAEPVARTVTDGRGNTGEVMIEEQQWVEEQVLDKLDTKALRDLTSALKNLTSTMRDLYGLPTQAEAEAQRIAAQRLELEMRKAEASGGDGEIRVSFVTEGGDGSEEWRK